MLRDLRYSRLLTVLHIRDDLDVPPPASTHCLVLDTQATICPLTVSQDTIPTVPLTRFHTFERYEYAGTPVLHKNRHMRVQLQVCAQIIQFLLVACMHDCPVRTAAGLAKRSPQTAEALAMEQHERLNTPRWFN